MSSNNREELRRLKDELATIVSHLPVLSGGEMGILAGIQEAKAKLEDLRRAVLNTKPQPVHVDELAPWQGEAVTFQGGNVLVGFPPQENTRLMSSED